MSAQRDLGEVKCAQEEKKAQELKSWPRTTSEQNAADWVQSTLKEEGPYGPADTVKRWAEFRGEGRREARLGDIKGCHRRGETWWPGARNARVIREAGRIGADQGMMGHKGERQGRQMKTRKASIANRRPEKDENVNMYNQLQTFHLPKRGV
ncbi:hypothetical protein FB451DRAFT_1185011 [Mycena latifolia]|nr:hypothetical protein FB451DRAFT_1185011 [Mycena latifolia]